MPPRLVGTIRAGACAVRHGEHRLAVGERRWRTAVRVSAAAAGGLAHDDGGAIVLKQGREFGFAPHESVICPKGAGLLLVHQRAGKLFEWI